jgi:hypothetical protein
MRLNRKSILKFGVIGSILGAAVLFFFGDGFLMAFYLAVEGAVIGFVIGVILTIVIAAVSGGSDS